jgi:hypothetical protein
MKIFLEVNEKEINEISNKIHSFQDDFLKWAINDESPAKHPQDLLWYLSTTYK